MSRLSSVWSFGAFVASLASPLRADDSAGMRKRLCALGVICVLGMTLGGGCGEDQPAETVTVERTVEKPAIPKKKHRRKPRPAPSPPALVHCDPNIRAEEPTTTCPFAQNVFWAYWTSGESSDSLPVWSPAAHASFNTTCKADGARITCTTTDSALVEFPQAAVDRYSQAQADAYASAHDLGPDPDEGLPGVEPAGGEEEDTTESADCQGYDPCIEPGDDVDCEGGSGNGPRYVAGPVDVSGSDPYGLDTDYDGVGCEY
jgi:hypothetical protein